MIKKTITEEQALQRLDMVAVELLPELSRSSVRKLIDDKRITVNGESPKSGYKLRTGDKLVIDFKPHELKDIPKIDLPILYEDDDCLVVVKPAGILTHSKGAFNPEATVATFIAPKIEGMTGDRAGIVHRLDRATSGVIICAKTPEALTAMQKEFSSRNVKKTYYAVVEGEVTPPKAIIEVPVERNVRDPKTFKPGLAGKPAVTGYEVVGEGNGYTLIKLEPTTGRTHQLRVHLKYIDHPILGDIIYGGTPHDRMMLHAERLEITLPNRQRKVFEAPLPEEFRAILEA